MPQMAPPAIKPLANNTPGPDSISASERLSERTFRSTSQRTIPPANIPADVVIGRYTPPATGNDDTPITSTALVGKTPMSTSPQPTFSLRTPSVLRTLNLP